MTYTYSIFIFKWTLNIVYLCLICSTINFFNALCVLDSECNSKAIWQIVQCFSMSTSAIDRQSWMARAKRTWASHSLVNTTYDNTSLLMCLVLNYKCIFSLFYKLVFVNALSSYPVLIRNGNMCPMITSAPQVIRHCCRMLDSSV